MTFRMLIASEITQPDIIAGIRQYESNWILFFINNEGISWITQTMQKQDWWLYWIVSEFLFVKFIYSKKLDDIAVFGGGVVYFNIEAVSLGNSFKIEVKIFIGMR